MSTPKPLINKRANKNGLIPALPSKHNHAIKAYENALKISLNGATVILGSAAYSSDLKQSSSPHAAANSHVGNYVFYSPKLTLV
jgi:hypothetical protein